MHRCDTCESLLHDALNLTVRGRRLDSIQRRQDSLDASSDAEGWEKSGRFDEFVARHNAECQPWNSISSRSGSPQLWAEDAFQRDLWEWEARTRQHLISSHPE